MYAEERQQAMADLIAKRGRLSVNELAEEYGVTTETVRRDLSVLERAGIIRRVHGGAAAAHGGAGGGDRLARAERDLALRDLGALVRLRVRAHAHAGFAGKLGHLRDVPAVR